MTHSTIVNSAATLATISWNANKWLAFVVNTQDSIALRVLMESHEAAKA